MMPADGKAARRTERKSNAHRDQTAAATHPLLMLMTAAVACCFSARVNSIKI
jgi:hypothetical protein